MQWTSAVLMTFSNISDNLLCLVFVRYSLFISVVRVSRCAACVLSLWNVHLSEHGISVWWAGGSTFLKCDYEQGELQRQLYVTVTHPYIMHSHKVMSL